MSLAVVSCVWQRPERLAHTLAQLGQQSVPFVLHLINNNPALHDVVEEAALAVHGHYPIVVYHNATNRGPQARNEVMHALAREYDYFMTIDDDAEFGPDLLAQWWALREPQTLQGWSGFRFVGNYWQRATAQPGEECHYLWGSNLFVPAAAVEDGRVTQLPERYWQCDDLWLCYHANHVAGLRLRAQKMPMRIHVDGKDTYSTQHAVKVQLLDELRAKGWAV